MGPHSNMYRQLSPPGEGGIVGLNVGAGVGSAVVGTAVGASVGCAVGVAVGGAHCLSVLQKALTQSSLMAQVLPASHARHDPPQSMSVSEPDVNS